MRRQRGAAVAVWVLSLPKVVPRICMLPVRSDLDDEDSELSAAAAAALLYVGAASLAGALVLMPAAAGRAVLLLEADLTAKCRLQPEHLTTSPSLNAVEGVEAGASAGVLLAGSLLLAALSASVSARCNEDPHCGQQSCAAVMRPERSEPKQRRAIAFAFTAAVAAPGQREEQESLLLAPRNLTTAVDTLRLRLLQRCDRQSAPLVAASGRRRRIIWFRLFFLLKYRRETTPLKV